MTLSLPSVQDITTSLASTVEATKRLSEVSGRAVANVTTSVGATLLYYVGPFFLVLAIILLIALIALASSNNKGTSLAQRKAPAAAPAKAPVPVVVQPKSFARPAPAIVRSEAPKVEAKPVMQPKSVAVPAPVAPVAAAEPAKQESKQHTLEDTFEAYRQAMLSTGPRRQMEENLRTEMQSKHTFANSEQWRNQTASLRKALKQENLEDFLERTNLSINDRMVGMLEAVEA